MLWEYIQAKDCATEKVTEKEAGFAFLGEHGRTVIVYELFVFFHLADLLIFIAMRYSNEPMIQILFIFKFYNVVFFLRLTNFLILSNLLIVHWSLISFL